MTEKTAKKGGWFRESQRHSLASKGIRTGEKKKARKPRMPKQAPVSEVSSKKPEKAEGREVLYPEDDWRSYTDDESNEELILIGEVRDPSSDEVTGLLFRDEEGKSTVRSLGEVRDAPVSEE